MKLGENQEQLRELCIDILLLPENGTGKELEVATTRRFPDDPADAKRMCGWYFFRLLGVDQPSTKGQYKKIMNDLRVQAIKERSIVDEAA